MRSLTFELTPTAEAGAVSPVCDDATAGADRAYSACRSGSGVERGVRPHRASHQGLVVLECLAPVQHLYALAQAAGIERVSLHELKDLLL